MIRRNPSITYIEGEESNGGETQMFQRQMESNNTETDKREREREEAIDLDLHRLGHIDV